MKPFNKPLLKRNSSLSLLAGASLTTLLTACNGGGDSGHQAPVVTAPTDNTAIYSTNISDNILVGERAAIKVAKHVTTSDDSEYAITAVESMSGGMCQVVSFGSDSFEVASTETQDCLYQYRVSSLNGNANSESYARIAAAPTYASTTLPRVVTSTLEGQEITIDIEAELATSTPNDSYQLQQQLVVIGNGSATYLDENRIQFVPSGKGQTEIYYSYESDSDIKQGTISVSVSELTENTPPTANVFAHEELIKLGESITIDVAPYVVDADGDDVQLIGIEDFNSTTALLSPTDLKNTQFAFESTTPGTHDVAYTVSDHMGGYTTAVARIEVEPDFSLIQDWEDIVTYDPVIDTEIRFFAPMTKVYADYVNAQYTSTYTENGENGLKGAEVATQTLLQARQYCKVRGGRLPLQRELETLIANETSAFSNHNWPTSKKYWTAENVSETNAATVNLNDGVIGNQSKTVAMYTTCVDLIDGVVKDFTSSVENTDAVSNRYDYQVQVFDPDGNVAPFADITLESVDDRGVFQNRETISHLVANAQGVVNDSYYDISFTEEVVSIEVSSDQELFPFIPQEDHLAINVTDPELWNSEEYWNREVYPPDENGLMLMPDLNNSKLFHIYKTPFRGRISLSGLE
ncbi:adhesion domain-containing protein [Vibrio sp. VNB-15]